MELKVREKVPLGHINREILNIIPGIVRKFLFPLVT